MVRLITLSVIAFLQAATNAQQDLYQPCPLLGPFVPPPRINASSPTVNSVVQALDTLLDDYIKEGDGRFGPISPNTTSFSIALFAGSNYVLGPEELSFFYEYHHTASEETEESLDKDSVFALGDLTQLFTVYAQLVELGDGVWSSSVVDFLPELANLSAAEADPIHRVQWSDVTLGSLAGQMSGIAREAGACNIDEACDRKTFLSALANKLPVQLPDTTPVASNAAFQVLALAVESATEQSFAQLFDDRISRPLGLDDTFFLDSRTKLFGNGLSNGSLQGDQAALGLSSTISDLVTMGRAILISKLLPPATTRRWLKPFTSTSNLRNAVGRPWEIYHYGNLPTDPVIDIYSKTGTVGRYSSYFGLVPSHDVGFAILAVDTDNDAPDLNAYADITLGAMLQIDKLARAQANATLVGTYTSKNNSTLTIGPATSAPGLAVTELSVNGTNWLHSIAEQAGIKASDVDLRLYPTSLEDGEKRAFRAVVQDKDALVDAGTPTCVSWQTVDKLQIDGLPLDEFVFQMDGGGFAVAVEIPALQVVLERPR